MYNGDVMTAEDAASWDVSVMTGRGLMADPALLRRARGGAAASRAELRDYVESLAEGYAEALGPDAALHKLWELWFYLIDSFPEAGDALKRMRKCRALAPCRDIARAVIDGERLRWES